MLAQEKLTEVHGYRVSVETLRKWMAEDGLWRRTRKCRGMGCIRAVPGVRRWASWCRPTARHAGDFDNWGPYCTLFVFIDDATSRLMALRFAEAGMRTLRGCLDHYGQSVKAGGLSS